MNLRLAQRVLGSISQYHRIQGSPELVEAAEELAAILGSIGADVDVKWAYYDEEHLGGWPLTGWSLEHGAVGAGPVRLTTYETPMVVAAHSPPGNVEAPVVFAPSIDVLDKANVDGRIVVVAAHHARRAYFKAQEAGAAAVAYYRRDAPEHAVPYVGLFLTPGEAARAKIPAVAVPRSMARAFRRSGRAAVQVEGRFYVGAKMPIVLASHGDPRIAFTAHMCHPGGMVNDNVSGVAGAVALMDMAVREGVDVAVALMPEYFGSAALMETGWRPDYVVNLDMIGEDQERTGATLTLVRPPYVYASPTEAAIWSSMASRLSTSDTFSGFDKLPSYRMARARYFWGSDHDVFISRGLPSAMVNQWPDRYYHTSMDTIDKVDLHLMALLLEALLDVARRGADPEAARRYFVGLATEYGDGYACHFLRSSLGLPLPCEPRRPPEGGGPRLRGPLTGRYMEERLGTEHWLVKLVENDRRWATIVKVYIPTLMDGTRSPETIVDMVVEEYPVDRGTLTRVVEAVADLA